METVLKAVGVRKAFGQNEVLKGVDLEVERGDVVVILGPSGAGKTTFLRCLNFLEKPDEGTVTIGDKTVDVRKASRKDVLEIRRRTAMVFQQYNLFSNKTALENVMEGLVYVKKQDRKSAEETAEKLLTQVGLADKYHSYPASLSGGQQQRVGIARALALNPDVILFDEPTSALDPELVGDVLKVMKDVARAGITMVVVTHEIQFALDIASRIVMMDRGIIIEQGTPQEMLTNAKEERTRNFLKKIVPEYSYVI